MTVPADLNKNIHNGDGSTTLFNFTYPIIKDADLTVQIEDASGTLETLTLTTHYSMSYVSRDTSGGSITVTDSSKIPASGEKIILLRSVSDTQDSQYRNTKDIPAPTLESDLDKRTMVQQDSAEKIERSIKLPVTDTTTDTEFPSWESDKILAWDTVNKKVVNKVVTDISTEVDITISPGDADKLVTVNDAETGYELKVIDDFDNTSITTSDKILFSDNSDSNKLKRTNVLGLLGLVDDATGILSGDGTELSWSTKSGYVTGLTTATSIINLAGDFDSRPLTNIDATGLSDGHTIQVRTTDDNSFRIKARDENFEILNETATLADRGVINYDSSIDTVTYKWGVSSASFNGSSNRLSFNDNSSWDIINVLNTTWTIDFWVKFDVHSGTEIIMAHYEDSNNHWQLFHVDGSGWRFNVVSGGVTVVQTAYAGEITDTNWHHVALVIEGTGATNEIGIYVDGTIVTHVNDSNTDSFAGNLFIGQAGGTNYFDGNLDSVRLTNSNPFSATPRSSLTDTITVPTAAHTTEGTNDKILMNFDRPNIVSKPIVGVHSSGVVIRWNSTESLWSVVSEHGDIQRPKFFADMTAQQANLTNNTIIQLQIDANYSGGLSSDYWQLLDKENYNIVIPWEGYVWKQSLLVKFTGGSALTIGDSLKIYIYEDSSEKVVKDHKIQGALSTLQGQEPYVEILVQPPGSGTVYDARANINTGASDGDVNNAFYIGYMI